jgi:hypothetical protein
VLDDLEMGRVSLEKSVMAEQLWPRYQLLPEFANVQFDQFKARLKVHQEQVIKKLNKKSKEWAAFLHGMELPTSNARSTRNDHLSLDRSQQSTDGRHQGWET